jgi:teichoic acid transport system ATP-binding protein
MPSDPKDVSPNGAAIAVDGVSKMYRIYDRPSLRLLEAFHPLRRKYHREFWALKDVSLTVKRGETVGIIGVNGSGKSTLLQLVCGILRPTRGEVRAHGRISTLLELGSGFNPEFTGRENVYLQGAILAMPRREIDRRFDAIAAFADIGGFLDQPVKTYSTGMLVRLAFSIAINVQPEILVVDEALSVGDVFFQAKCFHRMEELRRSGVTILLVSHEMNTVRTLCDRVVLLDAGEVVHEGEPRAAIETYFKRRAQLMGSVDLASAVPSRRAKDAVVPDATPIEAQAGALRYGNGKARLVEYSANGRRNCREISVPSGGELDVTLTHAVFDRIANPIIGIMIRLPNGTQLFGNNTSFNKAPIGVLAPGQKIRTSFRQKLYLHNGQYLVTLTIGELVNDEVVYVDRYVDALLLIVNEGPYPYSGVCNLEGACHAELAP